MEGQARSVVGSQHMDIRTDPTPKELLPASLQTSRRLLLSGARYLAGYRPLWGPGVYVWRRLGRMPGARRLLAFLKSLGQCRNLPMRDHNIALYAGHTGQP